MLNPSETLRNFDEQDKIISGLRAEVARQSKAMCVLDEQVGRWQTRAEQAEAEVARLTKLAKRAEDFDAGWLAGERGDPQAAGASADWKDGWDFSRALDAVDRLTAALRRTLPFVEHHAASTPQGHHCGDPSACCDATCVDAARDSELIALIRAALKGGGK